MIIWNLQNLTHRIVSNKLLVCCQKWFNMRITGSWNSWKREEWVPDIRVETKRLFLPRPVSSLLPKYTSEFTLMLKHLISGHIKRETDVFMSMELPISIWKWNPVFVTKISFIMMHTAHALACLKVYNQKHPPPVGLISPCFSSEPRRPLNVLLSTLSVSFHMQAQHALLSALLHHNYVIHSFTQRMVATKSLKWNQEVPTK